MRDAAQGKERHDVRMLIEKTLLAIRAERHPTQGGYKLWSALTAGEIARLLESALYTATHPAQKEETR